jgi:hypothetical protein
VKPLPETTELGFSILKLNLLHPEIVVANKANSIPVPLFSILNPSF